MRQGKGRIGTCPSSCSKIHTRYSSSISPLLAVVLPPIRDLLLRVLGLSQSDQGKQGNQHHGCDCCEQEVIYLPAAFNSSSVLPSCLRRRSSEARPVCRVFSPRMGHGLLAGPLDSVSLGLRHLSDYKQLVGNQLAVMALMSGCYSLVSGRTKVPRTARWSDGYPGMAMSVFGFISSIRRSLHRWPSRRFTRVDKTIRS